MLVLLVKSLFFRVAVRNLREIYLFVFQGLFKSVSFVIWSILLLIVWYGLFASDPFPARSIVMINGTSAVAEASLNFSNASWITILITSLIFLAIMILLKRILLLTSIYTVGSVRWDNTDI